MEKGSRDRYFQDDAKKLVPEGIEGRLPYKGPFSRYYSPISWRTSCRHGVLWDERSPGTLREKAQFIRMTGSGLLESHPHQVQITKEAPNYTLS